MGDRIPTGLIGDRSFRWLAGFPSGGLCPLHEAPEVIIPQHFRCRSRLGWLKQCYLKGCTYIEATVAKDWIESGCTEITSTGFEYGFHFVWFQHGA